MLTSDYTLIIQFTHQGKLAYFRPGFQSWVVIDCFEGFCFDVTPYQGLYYVIDRKGVLFAIDIQTDQTVEFKQVAKLSDGIDIFRLYLVEVDGKLLLVHRMSPDYEEDLKGLYTVSFKVYELDVKNGNCSWIEINNLGSKAVFLGLNSTVAVEILEDSDVLKPNCIYFTDVHTDNDYSLTVPEGKPISPYYYPSENSGKDLGFYHLQDGTLKRFLLPERTRTDLLSPHLIFPHMWVEQSF